MFLAVWLSNGDNSSIQLEKCVLDLDYADNIAACNGLMDNTAKGLQETTDNKPNIAPLEASKWMPRKLRLWLLIEDTSQRSLPKHRTPDITANWNPVKQETRFAYFPYLGSNITSLYDKLDKEISVRIGKTTGAFNQLNNIRKNRKVSINKNVPGRHLMMYTQMMLKKWLDPYGLTIDCSKEHAAECKGWKSSVLPSEAVWYKVVIQQRQCNPSGRRYCYGQISNWVQFCLTEWYLQSQKSNISWLN